MLRDIVVLLPIVHIAEGRTCYADSYSHAEGGGCTANGTSHAEGDLCFSTFISHAEGYGCTANTYSHSEGNFCYAMNYSHTEGYGCTALDTSHAEGFYNYADTGSHAEGSGCTAFDTSHAEGIYCYADTGSHAEGYGCTALNGSHAEGLYCYANNGSHAEGLYCYANNGSHAQGSGCSAISDSSFASGLNLIAGNEGCSIFGQNGYGYGTYSYSLQLAGGESPPVNENDGVSVLMYANIGGTANANGVIVASQFSSIHADYAEYFEWEDGNTGGEDRVGFFVQLDEQSGIKIKISTTSDNCIGIVSGSPGLIGNDATLHWKGSVKRDHFNRLITRDSYKASMSKVLKKYGIQHDLSSNDRDKIIGEITKKYNNEQLTNDLKAATPVKVTIAY